MDYRVLRPGALATTPSILRGNELRLDFKDGENSKRSQYWREADGTIRFRYESVYPKKGTELYEGRMKPAQMNDAEDRLRSSPQRTQ